MAWRLHHARQHIPAEGLEVEITGFDWVEPNLAVLQYREPATGRRMVDTFNIKDLEMMDKLSYAHSDEKVMAKVMPDATEDEDGHPEVEKVWHDGLKDGIEVEEEEPKVD